MTYIAKLNSYTVTLANTETRLTIAASWSAQWLFRMLTFLLLIGEAIAIL